MVTLPQIKPRQIEKILLKHGFEPRNARGSHVVFKHPNGRRTVVPAHNRPIRVGTLKASSAKQKLALKHYLWNSK